MRILRIPNSLRIPRLWQIVAVAFLAAPGAVHTVHAQSASCSPPDEGNRPYYRAASRIRYLPEIEAWAAEVLRRGGLARYVLHIDVTVRVRGRCYWTVDARAEAMGSFRFYVSPDGRRVLADSAAGPVSLAAWRRVRR